MSLYFLVLAPKDASYICNRVQWAMEVFNSILLHLVKLYISSLFLTYLLVFAMLVIVCVQWRAASKRKMKRNSSSC